MSPLARRSVVGLAWFHGALAAMIFVAAGSVEYWQGWLVWLLLLAGNAWITAYFLRHDPALVARRLNAGPTAEREAAQKRIQAAAVLGVGALVIVPALDHRLGWSQVPWPATFAGGVLIAVCYVILFLVFRANSYAAAVIETSAGHRVADSGPYAVVRHPMYAGAILLFAGMPLAMASWWGFVPAVFLALVLAWRLQAEEAFLVSNLAGYDAYRARVRWRLVPGLW